MSNLEEAFKQFVSVVEAEKADVEKQRKELADAQKLWEEMATKLDKTLLPTRIKLDVGGTVFATTMSTLTSAPNTFFAAMFSGRFLVKPTEDGAYFVDRDPLVFRYILNYLRGETPNVALLSKIELEQLRADASFYHVEGLLEMVTDPPEEEPIPHEPKISLRWQSGPNYTVSHDGIQLSASADGWNTTAITFPIPDLPVVKWGIRVITSKYNMILVGVAPSSITQNTNTRGWYLFLQNGGLYYGFEKKSGYSDKYKAGSIIVATFHKASGELSYAVNGKEYGVAFKGIKTNVPMVATALIHDSGDSVEIVDMS